MDVQHHMFIQAFMWKKICSSEEVISLYKKCHEKDMVPLSHLKQFVEKINSALKPINMEIRKGIDEVTGEQYYILVNAANNAISRLSNEYKSKEIELFKKIINCIIESNEGKVNSTTILNMADDVKLSKVEADNIIIKFSQDGWLNENEGYIFFSSRTIAELQNFFKEHYKDYIILCGWCNNIIFQGDTCINCGSKIHFHCKRSYFTNVKHNQCPSCHNKFT